MDSVQAWKKCRRCFVLKKRSDFMSKPVIGITAAHHTEELETFPRQFYVESIRKAGGLPLLIPPPETEEEADGVLDLIDGLLLSGGGDLTPYSLGEEPILGIGTCIPQRDKGETFLTRGALARDLPLLGICRGIQVLAAVAGGKLYQDICAQLGGTLQHAQKASRSTVWHKVVIRDSLLYSILGEGEIGVNSFHHQAVREVPPGFLVNALASDGLIEGIEREGARFCLGVQWHPESMPEEEHSRRVFFAFIAACRHDWPGA